MLFVLNHQQRQKDSFARVLQKRIFVAKLLHSSRMMTVSQITSLVLRLRLRTLTKDPVLITEFPVFKWYPIQINIPVRGFVFFFVHFKTFYVPRKINTLTVCLFHQTNPQNRKLFNQSLQLMLLPTLQLAFFHWWVDWLSLYWRERLEMRNMKISQRFERTEILFFAFFSLFCHMIVPISSFFHGKILITKRPITVHVNSENFEKTKWQ